MKSFSKLLSWWLTLSVVWGVFRLTNPSEVVSELIAKPIIWLGITALFIKLNFIPKKIINYSKKNYLKIKPINKVFLLPSLFIIFYFFLINFRNVSFPHLNFLMIGSALLVNFTTGVVEEVVYRGILYVWLLRKTTEIKAFFILQLLFLLGHLPILIINSESTSTALIHAFFIILIGSIHTLIFRLTKSLYASSLTHGIWNSLTYLILLS